MRLRFEKCMSSKAFKDPLDRINKEYMLLDKQIKRIENTIEIKVKEKKTYMVEWISKLDTLSPLKTLTRGYSIVEKDGKMVNSIKKLNTNDEIRIRLTDGEVDAKIL